MSEQLILSLITGIFVGGAAGYLGSLMITRKMALVGDALGHVALPGMGLALLLSIDVSFGAFAFLLAGISLVWLFGLRASISTEALVGVVFVASLAIGFLIIPEHELLEALVGDVTQVSFIDAGAAIFFSLLTFFAVRRIYPKMVLSGISEDLAKVQGINTKKQNFVYLLLIAAVVALGVKITGTLLVGALVIVPAAISRNLSRNLKQYTTGAVLWGVLSAVLGILLFGWINFPAGPLVILISVLFFVLSLIFKRSS